MKRIFLLFSICCFALSSIAQTRIPLANYKGHPKLKQVEVVIGGKKYNFLFDTGAGVTLLSPEIVNDLNKEPYGRGVGYRMLGEKVEYSYCDSIPIELGAYHYFHSRVGVWDVNQVLPKDWPRIDGIISLGTFSDTTITIDLSNNLIMVETDSSLLSGTKDMQKICSQFANGFTGMESSIFIGVVRNSKTWWFLMDSGNLDKNKLSHKTVKEWNIEASSDSARVEIPDQEFDLCNFLKTAQCVGDDIIYDGVLCYDFLFPLKITIAKDKQMVWIK